MALPVIQVTQASWLAITRFGFHFIVDSVWDPVAGQFGAFPLIVGTMLTSFLALLIAVPLSMGVAVYLTEFAPEVIPANRWRW